MWLMDTKHDLVSPKASYCFQLHYALPTLDFLEAFHMWKRAAARYEQHTGRKYGQVRLNCDQDVTRLQGF